MEFEEKLAALATKIRQQNELAQTEEATKNAFVMPFIQNVLGYDIFNPTEVMPEFTSDVGTKKGEKVDYAILKDGKIQILIECKKYGEDLHINHASQLYRYFSVTETRIAILTNGRIYQFFTDSDAPNKMDSKPFMVLDMLDIEEHHIPEVRKLTKPAFDVESIVNAAEELKYVGQIKRVLDTQLTDPSEEFVKFIASQVYDGVITQRVRDQFRILITKAVQQFLSDKINDRLKSAINQTKPEEKAEVLIEEELLEDDNGIVTTQEEIDGYNIVKAIARISIDAQRIIPRDTKSYFGILCDDNNRKPICRLHFNGSKKYLGVFDQNKKETKYLLDSLDDIFKYSSQIQETCKAYASETVPIAKAEAEKAEAL